MSPDTTAEQRCPKCKHKLAADRPAASPANSKENAALSLSLAGMPVELDEWELEDDLRATKRILTLVRAGEPAVSPFEYKVKRDALPISQEAMPSGAGEYRPRPVREAAHREPTVRESLTPGCKRPRREPVPQQLTKEEPPTKSSLAWVVLSLGLMAFVCGGVLVAWSFAANRPDLWKLGLPITFAGQAGLIIGLVLQLDGLWHSTRRTTETLEELDDELAELKQATTLLHTSHSGPAQSFYAHYSGGASPHLLLADLKGQLDLLATRLAKDERAA